MSALIMALSLAAQNKTFTGGGPPSNTGQLDLSVAAKSGFNLFIWGY